MEEPWTRLVLIAKFSETSSRIQAVAVLESGDDAPVTTANDGETGVASVLERLRRTMAREEKSRPFVACRVRLSKEGLALDLDFEPNDRDRWDYDPRDRASKWATLGLDG